MNGIEAREVMTKAWALMDTARALRAGIKATRKIELTEYERADLAGVQRVIVSLCQEVGTLRKRLVDDRRHVTSSRLLSEDDARYRQGLRRAEARAALAAAGVQEVG